MKTGIFKIQNSELIELVEIQGNGSINSIIEELGYNSNQIHLIFTFDSKSISKIGVKILSKNPVFVICQDGVSNLKMSTLGLELENVDWGVEYSTTVIEDILDEGIEEQNLTFDFLMGVTRLERKTSNLFLATDLDLYLHFENQILISYNTSNGLSASSKWLKSLNGDMFSSMLKEANDFHISEMDSIEEVNCQCDAIRSIPGGMTNEFLYRHLNRYGNYNFFNLLIENYPTNFTIDSFLFVNKGRYVRLSETEMKVGDIVYHFEKNGKFIGSWI